MYNSLYFITILCKFFSYKSEKNEVPVVLANGSTVPLVEIPSKDPELGEYDPFQHRKLEHPTS